MILDTLDNLSKYASLSPLFPKAIEFITTADLANLPLGRNEIQGDEIFANVMEAQPRTKEEVPIEAPILLLFPRLSNRATVSFL